MRFTFETLRTARQYLWCVCLFVLLSGSFWSGALADEITETRCELLSLQQIADLTEAWRLALKSANLSRLIDLYSNSAVLSVDAGDPGLVGTLAIGRYLETLLRQYPEATVSSEVVEIGCNKVSNSGLVVYRIAGTRKGTRMLLGGSFVTQYRFENDAWRIFRQVLGATPITVDQGLEQIEAARSNTEAAPG